VSSEEKRSSEQPAQQPPKLDLYVIARIIVVLKEHGPINRTNLATLSGLAYDKLVKYLAWMIEKKLIASDENDVISLTENQEARNPNIAGCDILDFNIAFQIRTLGLSPLGSVSRLGGSRYSRPDGGCLHPGCDLAAPQRSQAQAKPLQEIFIRS
jgi:predicted transcriptional regulator